MGYSTMGREEREKQFTTYFGSTVHDGFTSKKKIALDQYKDLDKYQGWRAHESRVDCPARHGKYGRRAFDPQVREKPINNPHMISEVENAPQEYFHHQQERVSEILDRSVPRGKNAHFKPYQPQAEQ